MAWKKKLAEIFVEVTAKTSPLKSAMAKAKAIIRRGMDSLIRLAKRGALAIGVGLAAAFAWVIKAAMKQEDAIARLNTTLKATGHAAGLTSKQIQKMAADLQKLTRFGDETILAMQTMLLTFKQIKGDEFERATMAALDMATAEAAVSGRAVDLTATAIRLGKALNEPITGLTALRRVGVQFTKSQEVQIKRFVQLGQVARAQRLILKELESQFGGMAGTVDTTSGRLAQLWNVIGDIAERVGKPLADKLKVIAEDIKDWAVANEELIATRIGEWVDKFATQLERLKPVLAWIVEHWKAAVGVSMVVVVAPAVAALGKIAAVFFHIVRFIKLTILGLLGVSTAVAKVTTASKVLFGIMTVGWAAIIGLAATGLGLLTKYILNLLKIRKLRKAVTQEELDAHRKKLGLDQAREKKQKEEIKDIKEVAAVVVEVEKETTDQLREEYVRRLELARDYYESMEGYEKELSILRDILWREQAKDIAKLLKMTEKEAYIGLAKKYLAEETPMEDAVERARVGFAGFGDAWTEIAQQLTGKEKLDERQLREQQQQTKYLRSISEDIDNLERLDGGYGA